MYPFFLFDNHNVSLAEINESDIISVQDRSRVVEWQTTLKKNRPIRTKVYFAKVDVITDYSIWPEILHSVMEDSKTNVSTWIYDEEIETTPA